MCDPCFDTAGPSGAGTTQLTFPDRQFHHPDQPAPGTGTWVSNVYVGV